MNSSIQDIRDIIESDSPESMYSSYVDKINTFEENIRRQQEHLVMLRDFEHRIKRALSHMNTSKIIKKLIYIFPKSEKLPMYTQSFFLYLIGIVNLF